MPRQCCECGCNIGYLSVHGMENIEEIIKTKFYEKVEEKTKILFVLNDSLVLEAKQAQVFLEVTKEIEEIKEQNN